MTQVLLRKRDNKKTFSISNDKKTSFKQSKGNKKPLLSSPGFKNTEQRNRKFNRKFIEQQATKAFIKKEENQLEKAN